MPTGKAGSPVMRAEDPSIQEFVDRATALIGAAVDYAGSSAPTEVEAAAIRKLQTACQALMAALQQASVRSFNPGG